MYKDRLILERENKELKQYELAKILGIYKGTYNQYETEYTIIPIKHLITICNYFDISLDYIFGFTNIKRYSNYTKEFNKNIVGTRLKEFRKEKNITQKNLANSLNTTQSVIADYEKGRYLIATPFLYTICKKYKISADYLLGRTNTPELIF